MTQPTHEPFVPDDPWTALPHAWLAVRPGDRSRPPALDARFRWIARGEIWLGCTDGDLDGGPFLVAEEGWAFAGRIRLFDQPEDERAALHALDVIRRHGPAGLSRLKGLFGFSVTDGRRLLVVTDRMGMEPVYVARFRDGLRVAGASLNDVLAPPGAATTFDPRWLVVTLAAIGWPTYTPHREAQRLDPAHHVDLTADTDPVRWWSPEPSYRPRSRKRDAGALRDLLFEVIEDHLPTGRRTGAELSGGLDSSAVVAVTAYLHPGVELPVFSQVLPPDDQTGAIDEREYIDEVIRAVPGLDPHDVYDPAPPAWPIALSPERDPMQSWSDYGEALIERAGGVGVEVLLSGFGGDEYSSFYSPMVLPQMLLRGRLLRLAREASAVGARRGWSKRRALGAPIRNAVDLLRSRSAPLGLIDPDELFLSRRALREVDLDGLQRPRTIRPRHAGPDAMLWRFGGNSGAMRAQRTAPLAAMRRLVYRYPLQDPRLVCFALSLPPDRHVGDGFHRLLWRMATEGVLPDTVRLRLDKRPPLPGAGARAGRLAAAMIEHGVEVEGTFAAEWLDVRRVREALGEGRRGRGVGPASALRIACGLNHEAARSGWAR